MTQTYVWVASTWTEYLCVATMEFEGAKGNQHKKAAHAAWNTHENNIFVSKPRHLMSSTNIHKTVVGYIFRPFSSW